MSAGINFGLLKSELCVNMCLNVEMTFHVRVMYIFVLICIGAGNGGKGLVNNMSKVVNDFVIRLYGLVRRMIVLLGFKFLIHSNRLVRMRFGMFMNNLGEITLTELQRVKNSVIVRFGVLFVCVVLSYTCMCILYSNFSIICISYMLQQKKCLVLLSSSSLNGK